MTLNNSTSEISNSFILPSSSDEGFHNGDNATIYDTNIYLDDVYGGFYTFYAATAGSATKDLTSGNAPYSICPKGWRLPKGGSNGEYVQLFNKYPNLSLMMASPVPNFQLGGSISSKNRHYMGEFGYYWSSTIIDETRVYRLILGQRSGMSVDPVRPADSIHKSLGHQIRCISKM